jgi:hypothetical protein
LLYLQDLLPIPSLAGYVITAEVLPGHIWPGDNTVMTDWADLRDQINKRELAVTRNGEDAVDKFLTELNAYHKADYKVGGVTRWAVMATGPRAMQLCLLGLPASSGRIKANSLFRMDNCPAILLGTLPLAVHFNKRRTVSGPVPTLFSPDPPATEEALNRDPTIAYPGKKD